MHLTWTVTPPLCKLSLVGLSEMHLPFPAALSSTEIITSDQYGALDW